MTQKARYGSQRIDGTIAGIDITYGADVVITANYLYSSQDLIFRASTGRLQKARM